jgi:hypothetical protein
MELPFYRDLVTSSWLAEEVLGKIQGPWQLMNGRLTSGKSECMLIGNDHLNGPNDQ